MNPKISSKTPVPAPAGRAQRRSRRFRASTEGSAAIEFGVLALPFIALIIAILEGGLVFWADQILAHAVKEASRSLYTGRFQQQRQAALQAQQVAPTFQAEVCRHIPAMIDCAQLKVDVQTFASAAFPDSMPPPIITDPDGTRRVDPAFGAYNEPGPSHVVLVRAVVEYPVITPVLGANASNLTSSRRLLMGSAAFRTEAF